jgi:hypothetical protein
MGGYGNAIVEPVSLERQPTTREASELVLVFVLRFIAAAKVLQGLKPLKCELRLR